MLFHDFHWGFGLYGIKLFLELECLIHGHYQHYHRVKKWLVWLTQNRLIFWFVVIITIIFNIITWCKNYLWWLTQNRMIFCKRTLIMSVRTANFIASILKPLVWENMFIEDNILATKISLDWISNKTYPFVCFLKPIKTHFDALGSNLHFYLFTKVLT